LSLGEAPSAIGESCDIGSILATAVEDQSEACDRMIGILTNERAEPLNTAARILAELQRSFGEDQKDGL
jgi:hypothetical protein